IIKHVVDNGRLNLQSGYLDILCDDESHRAWAQIVTKECVNFLHDFRDTSMVPALHHVDNEAVVDMCIVITSYPGDPMTAILRYVNKDIPLKLASELLKHMVTLARRGKLWIALDPDDVFLTYSHWE
ncbi:hypothetical protein AAF712_013636, partial [Marasmius tenuissimus]